MKTIGKFESGSLALPKLFYDLEIKFPDQFKEVEVRETSLVFSDLEQAQAFFLLV